MILKVWIKSLLNNLNINFRLSKFSSKSCKSFRKIVIISQKRNCGQKGGENVILRETSVKYRELNR